MLAILRRNTLKVEILEHRKNPAIQIAYIIATVDTLLMQFTEMLSFE